ncbi:trafficking protein particle complex subunit 2 isoform X2 [Populus alba x Populus x berolinensis]|uniref:Trafficking protein particle complex subunit 2 isoform X2 n=1 Tax=Populus alba x Populus x berolinensis TaxID=444605 RepID=A0AAD6R9L0_9ROSI|nr:trafficking protein particle complex subunit 2 isoform X2 [Populus alba x Populus x berolinensis]
MATTACFIIVSRNDIPIYEAEVGSATKREDAAQMHQFILHAALDIVQDLAWTTSAMYLKAIDRFNDMVVSVYVTAGHILCICDFVCYSIKRFMLLHDSRNDDGIKSFFQEVHELYIKVNHFLLLLVGTLTCNMLLFNMDADLFKLWIFLYAQKLYLFSCLCQSFMILLNPLYLPGSRITSSHFDTKVRALARKYL